MEFHLALNENFFFFKTPKRPDTTRWSGVNDSLKSFIDMI